MIFTQFSKSLPMMLSSQNGQEVSEMTGQTSVQQAQKSKEQTVNLRVSFLSSKSQMILL
jgi:hypothetical protein